MIWPATWLGAAAGFAFASIPGALLGGLLGHTLDRQLRLPSWSALFAMFGGSSKLRGDRLRFVLLGRLAKQGGRVQAAHITQARDEMRRLSLDPAAEQWAISAFTQGKNGEDNLQSVLTRLSRQRGEMQSLLLSCWRLVLSTGAVQPAERTLILQWGKWAGWTAAEVEALTIGIQRPATGQVRATDSDYRAALRLLGVTPGSDAKAIKNAYRRLLSQHHPDKRAGAGATAVQVRAATEKTQQLRSAYALVRERHGFR